LSALDTHLDRPRPATAPQLRPGPAAPAARPPIWKWLVLFTVLGSAVMDLLDSTIVNVAAPAIRTELHASTTALQWIIAGYPLVFAVMLITGGRLGDIAGRRRMFLAGLTGFTVCSALCSVAASPQMLVGSRIAQGLAAAAMIPQGITFIRSVFPADQTGAALGMFGPVMGIAALSGPIIGGALVSANVFGLGWRSIFWVNVPVGLAALAAAARLLPADRPRPRATRPQLDLCGAVLSTLGVLLLIYPLVQGRAAGWPAWTYVSMAAAAGAFAVFAAQQRHRHLAGRTPLIEPSLLGKRGFVGGLAFSVAFFAAFIGLGLVLTLRMQSGLGWSALHAGLSMVPFSAGAAVGAGLGGGILAPKYGRRALHAGIAIMAAGVAGALLTFQYFGSGLTSWQLIPALTVSGIGMGVLITSYFGIVISAVDDAELGSASGVMNAVQQLGGSIGVAALGSVYFDRLASHGSASATAAAMLVSVALLVGCAALVFLLPRKIRPGVTEM
jgi:EmrB/QacA subfamily drug resistance transporter